MTMIDGEPEADWWWFRAAGARLRAAIHMLHEQAHGDVPYKTCQQSPCCYLPLDLAGPAPRVLP